MGQQQSRQSKVKTSQFNTIQPLPSDLKAFGTMLQTQKPVKVGPCEFLLGKGKDSQFSIKTGKDAEDITKYQGYLEVYSNSNKIFAGTVDKLHRQGLGVEYDSGRVFYRGEFSNDQYQGWGQTVRYQGQFKSGRKEGWGKWQDNSFFYEGTFRDDKFNGIGYLNLSAKQVSPFMDMQKPLDVTEKVTVKYAGEWANGRMHGSGKIVTNNQIYQGGFSEGLYSGEGVLTREGKAKAGKFLNGKAL